MATMQVAGDCQTAVCDGHGGARHVTDDSDAPHVTGECMLGTCTNGQPYAGPAQPSTPCGDGLVCDNGGTCVGCIAAIECPGVDTACQSRVCLNEACGVTNTASGVKLATQTKGTCHVTECDGSGSTMSVVDDTNKPNSNNPCILDACTNGVPSSTPKPPGTACGTGMQCNASGTCAPIPCGNGVIDSGEECDGANLNGATCTSLGFQTGTLACSGTCSFNTSGCSTCGDGLITGGELCDGSALGTATCSSLGHAPGTLACDATCDGYDTTGCTGGYIAANTSFTGKVCVDGLRYGAPNQNQLLAVCTEDNGVWRGTVQTTDVPPLPLADPSWINADGTAVGQQVTSLLGRGIAIFNQNEKVGFWTTDTTGLNYWGTNSSGFNATPPTWQTGASNQVSFTQDIFAMKLGSSTNNFMGGWDPTSGQAVILHGNTNAASPALLFGAGVTGTVTSIVSGNDNLSATTFDIHVAVNGTTPAGDAALGGGIYWTCNNGMAYVEDDTGISAADKALVYKLTADQFTYVAHATTRLCAASGTNVALYASVMYAALLGGSSIYKTTDGGATWAVSNTGLPAGVKVYAIAIDCAQTTGGAVGMTCPNDQLLYAATSAGLYKSIDAGGHWVLDGLEGSVVRAVALETTHRAGGLGAAPDGATEVGNVATFTIASFPVKVGDQVTITGVADPGYNGTWTVASVVSTTQFTATLPTTGLSASGGGTAYELRPRVFAATDQESAIFQTNVP
jgi:hypothetical protein